MRKCLWSVVLLLCFTGSLVAQEVRGNISGTVKDSVGVVPGASVRITNTDTGIAQNLVTNGSGYFEAPLLQPGNYEVVVEMSGFKKIERRGIVLAVSQQVNLPFLLEVGGITESVIVTSATPLLDTSSVSSAQTFDARMVEALPMISNMPIMLTRFAAGVNPTPTQTLVSQGFADGTTGAAGEVVGGVGSNTYSIDGATNSGTGRRLAASPNADMIEEMRVESSNFDASIGHGLGLQISMMTKAGSNQYRGTSNYQYWTNKLNALNPNQRATFSDAGKKLYESGRSHNAAFTLGGPLVIPGVVNGKGKIFFFGNYSYVNDFIPGKNQGTSTVPANAKHLAGDFSDLLTLPNPAQYQIYDPLTVRVDPNNSARFIRDPFPNNIIPANRIINPLYQLYGQMVPPPNQNFVENGTTPSSNYYQGGQPDSPASHLFAGRVDWNLSQKNRVFIRASGNTFLEGVNDWTYEVPAFKGLHSLDRARYNWAFVGNWTHTAGRTVVDTQLATNRFFQGDLRKRLHEYKPTDMGFPSYLDEFCASQGDCMLPQITINGYQGVSAGRSSDDIATNFQATVNLTKIVGRHTLRSGIDARLAQRYRGPGGSPSSALTYGNEFTRQASDTSQLTPSNLGLSLASFMLGVPSTVQATIQDEFDLRNHFFAGFAQDSWRVNPNLTINYGLRIEREDGITEDAGKMVVGFDPAAQLAISDLVEAAYAKAPLAQLPASAFDVVGGPTYARASGNGATWKPEWMVMPRVSLAYKLGDKTVLKAGYGLYYDTLNAADYTNVTTGYSSTTTNTNSTDFGRTFTLGNPYAGVLANANPFPVRADGLRFVQPVSDTLGVNTSIGLAQTLRFNLKHARQQRTRVAIQREVLRNTSVEVSYDYMFSDRAPIDIRQDYLPEQFWIPGSLNARDAAAQGVLDGNVANPYAIANLAALATSNPTLYGWISGNSFFTAANVPRNRLLRPYSQYTSSTTAGLVFGDLPLGEAKVKALQINTTRRFAQGFTSNLAISFTRSRNNRTVQEFDRAPTLWVENNNSRPWRLSGGAVLELPFGRGKAWLNGGGLGSAIAGGWQLAGTFEAQPGSLLQFGNLFFYGDINKIKKDNPEIAIGTDGKIDASKYYFNIDGFETSSAKTPTSFQTRAFPFDIAGLRGPGIRYVNMNVSRSFNLGGRRTIQTRVDVQNLFNYAGFSNPVVDPINTNFGKVVQAVSAAGAMRFIQFGFRYSF